MCKCFLFLSYLCVFSKNLFVRMFWDFPISLSPMRDEKINLILYIINLTQCYVHINSHRTFRRVSTSKNKCIIKIYFISIALITMNNIHQYYLIIIIMFCHIYVVLGTLVCFYMVGFHRHHHYL
jgi:hypothetical protein